MFLDSRRNVILLLDDTFSKHIDPTTHLINKKGRIMNTLFLLEYGDAKLKSRKEVYSTQTNRIINFKFIKMNWQLDIAY